MAAAGVLANAAVDPTTNLNPVPLAADDAVGGLPQFSLANGPYKTGTYLLINKKGNPLLSAANIKDLMMIFYYHLAG